MTHDADHDHRDTAQADFVGWLALALIAAAIIFPLFILLAATTRGV